MTSAELKERTNKFAHDCVKLAVNLPRQHPLTRVLSHQLIKSSTSTAANYRAACLGMSKAMFISKLSIVVEEVDESGFWLAFGRDENLLPMDDFKPLVIEANALGKIFVSSRMTAQNRRK